MARILAYICNDISLSSHLFKTVEPSESLETSSSGIGWVQNERSLLRINPKPSRTSPIELIADVPARATIASLNDDQVTRNAHDVQPFRFRRWVFASTGMSAPEDLPRQALVDHVAPFLVQNIKGSTLDEVVFHVLMTHIHQAETRAGDRNTEELANAILEGVQSLRRLDKIEFQALIATHRNVFSVGLGSPIYAQSFAGLDVQEEALFAGHKPKTTSNPAFRAAMLQNWEGKESVRLNDGVSWIDANWEIKTLPL